MEAFARFITEHPRRVGIVFAVLTCLLGLPLLRLGVDFTPQAMFNQKDPDYAFYAACMEQFGTDDSWLLVLARGEDVFTPSGMSLLARLTERIGSLPGVKRTRSLTNLPEIRHDGAAGFSVLPFLSPPPETGADYAALRGRALANPLYRRLYVSPDGAAAAVTAELADDIQRIDDIRAAVESVESVLAEVSPRYPGFELLLGGIPYVRVDIIRLLIRDQLRFMPVCGLVLLGVAYLTFGRLRTAILPFVVVLASVVWGMGLMSLAGGELNVLTNTLPTLVMIIGVADSIHLIGRYEEEIRKGCSRRDAIRRAVAHIGAACFYTSFTTAIAFASLGASTNELLSGFGIFTALAVLAAYAVTLTLLPLLLFRWGLPEGSTPGDRDAGERLAGILDRCAGVCIRRPGLLFTAGLSVLVLSLAGAWRTGISNSLFEFYAEDSPVYRNHMAMEASLAGIVPYTISFQGPEGLFKEPAFLEKLSAVQAFLDRDPFSLKSLSLADFVKEMHWAFGGETTPREIPSTREAVAQYLLLYEMSGEDEDFARLVDASYGWGNIDVRCRADDSDVIARHVERVEAFLRSVFPEQDTAVGPRITGVGVFAYRTLDELMGDMIRSIFMACAVIFAVIAIAFRSLRIALVSLLPNLIPVLLTYGAMGWLGIRLELSTVVVFSVSLGIAVDDSIHFLVRFREELAKHGDHERAVRGAFRGSGRAIIYTTVILVLGLGVLALSSLPPTVRFAMLTATTLTSALVADLFVLPACLLVFRSQVWPDLGRVAR